MSGYLRDLVVASCRLVDICSMDSVKCDFSYSFLSQWVDALKGLKFDLVLSMDSMNDKQKEEIVRSQLENLKNDKVESLLVQNTDWGINVRMFLNDQLYELDLVTNWDGYEVTFVDDDERDTIQIDELEDLVSVMGVS